MIKSLSCLWLANLLQWVGYNKPRYDRARSAREIDSCKSHLGGNDCPIQERTCKEHYHQARVCQCQSKCFIIVSLSHFTLHKYFRSTNARTPPVPAQGATVHTALIKKTPRFANGQDATPGCPSCAMSPSSTAQDTTFSWLRCSMVLPSWTPLSF